MNLRQLFENKKFEKVINLFYSKKDRTEEEYIIAALAFLNLNKVNKAISTLKELLRKNPDNLDALFNLTTIYYKKKNWNRIKEFGLKYFEKDPDDWAINDILAEVWLFEGDFDKAITYLENAFKAAPKEMTKYFEARISFFKNKITNAKKLPKLAFICAKGLDNFINEIIEGLSENYWVRKFVVTTDKEIYSAIDWGDIIWFEWANEVAIIGSNYSQTQIKPVILRLHSYEALSYYPTKINWNNIDKLILVAEHIRDIIKMYMPDIENMVDIEIIPNGIDIETINFKKRQKGFNIAWVAHISHKKNPPMMLQIIKKLVEKDNRYKLHIAGDFQDMRYEIYLKHMVKEMNLENNVIFYGWVDDMDEWWEDKNYLLSTSVHEGHPYNIMEGMARGLKPVIHNYYGSKKQWPENLIFNTVDEAVNLILNADYNPEEYRRFVEKLSLKNQISLIKKNVLIYNKELELINNLKNSYLEDDYMALLSKWFHHSKMNFFKKIMYYYYLMYYKMPSYERFSNMPDEVYNKIYNKGFQLLEKIDLNYKKKKTSKLKKILCILNGLDLHQSPIKMHYLIAKEFKKFNIEYELMSVFGKSDFSNYDQSIEALEKDNISYFIPQEKLLYKKYIELSQHINNNDYDIVIFTSFYFSPFSILLYPLVKTLNIPAGRFVHQQPENFFDEKLAFVVNWDYLKYHNKNKNIFDFIWPVNTELINSKKENIRTLFKISSEKKIILSLGKKIKFLNQDFWNFIFKILENYKEYVFVAIGCGNDIIDELNHFELKQLYKKYKNRIFLIDYIPDAYRFLNSVDIFLNTFPQGGGSSLAEAYYIGLPILSFYNKDFKNPNPISNSLSLIGLYYNNAEKIFPEYPDINGLINLFDKIHKNPEYLDKYRKYKSEDLSFSAFVNNLINFLQNKVIKNN
ncbi:glycosyltransferase [Marinitoga sp. 1137]|uniref:glycosyltransferase n=1 Tax=Marinitoga sp. 1137 TaxID=1545835 RepID=UPI0009529895|nr:glycosyltransferase [Marinitoga sp. 1137]